jgi:ABC-type methionine transport system ATPase subunit
MMPALISGMKREEAKSLALELLNDVGLGHRLGHKPGELSGGEQQRVAIARALVLSPPLLLADEPTGELDSQTAVTILDAMANLNRIYGITIVIVTHDMSITRKVDRVVTIRDGRASLEAMRVNTFRPPPEPAEIINEFIVVDRAGRLQLPSEFMMKLNLSERVKLELGEDSITIVPDRGEEKKD